MARAPRTLNPFSPSFTPDRYNGASHIPRIRELLTATFPSERHRYLPCGPDCQPIHSLEVPAQLLELDRFFQKPCVWTALDDAFIRDLLDFLARNICEQLPSISPRHQLAGFIGPLQATHRQAAATLHGIAGAALRNLPAHWTEEWARTRLLRALIAGLGSPDEFEYGSFRTLLSIVCDVFPDLQARACEIMRERLSLAPLLSAQSINGILQFMLTFYRNNPLNLDGFQWFRTVLLPLFASPLLPQFHGTLEQLCTLFGGYFEEAAPATVQYLFSHWPATLSAKIALYLESAAHAACALGEDLRRRTARPLFARIAEIIASGPVRAIATALRLLSDERFLALFAADARVTFPAVQAGVAALARTDIPELRGLPATAMAALARRVGEAGDAPAAAPAESTRDEKWRLVRCAAGGEVT